MRAVEAECLIKRSPENVLDVFLNVADICKWWGADRGLIEPKVGGVWALAWNVSENGFQYVKTGTISKYEPAYNLEIANLVYFNSQYPVFGPMKLIIEVKQMQTGTLLTLCQKGYQTGESWDWYYNAVTQAWPVVLKQIKDYMESGASVSS